MILQETYTLANGIAIPKLGLGTWFIDNNKAAQAVRTAVELGYRCFRDSGCPSPKCIVLCPRSVIVRKSVLSFTAS